MMVYFLQFTILLQYEDDIITEMKGEEIFEGFMWEIEAHKEKWMWERERKWPWNI